MGFWCIVSTIIITHRRFLMNTPQNSCGSFDARRGAGLLLILALIAALAVPTAAAAPAAQTATILRIGYLGSNTSQTAQGAQLAIDQINSGGGFQAADGVTYQFDLTTLTNPPTVDSLAGSINAMIAQGVIAILGPDTNDLLTQDNVQALIATGVPVLTGATIDALTDSDTADVLFRLRAPERVYSFALASYLIGDLGLSSIVLVQTNVESTEALLDFDTTLSASGIRAAGKVQLASAVGLEDQGNAVLGLNPEAVVMWGPPEDAALLLNLLRGGGWHGVFAYRQAEEAAQAKILPDELADGVIGVTSWSFAYPGQAARIFLNDYLLAFGRVPGPLSAAAYDALWYLRATIIDAGPTPSAVRAALLNGPARDLVEGTLDPSAFGNGDLIRMAMVYRVGPGGGPTVVAQFNDSQRVAIQDAGN
jgi:ABC-type branched-subunit amino acid transport system substrate-binding protein